MDTWNWEKYIRPILNQLRIKNGSLSHRITNKKIEDKFIDDLVLTFNAEKIEFEDPSYGSMEANNPELWFEQRYDDKLSIRSLNELENNHFEFKPGEVFGIFSNEIDIMPLKIKFGDIRNKTIHCELELTFTNRDNLFEGSFKDHSMNAIKIKTKLTIEPLVYLDYHNLIKDKLNLLNSLNSEIYDIENIEEYNFGWKDGDMKAYKIGLN